MVQHIPPIDATTRPPMLMPQRISPRRRFNTFPRQMRPNILPCRCFKQSPPAYASNNLPRQMLQTILPCRCFKTSSLAYASTNRPLQVLQKSSPADASKHHPLQMLQNIIPCRCLKQSPPADASNNLPRQMLQTILPCGCFKPSSLADASKLFLCRFFETSLPADASKIHPCRCLKNPPSRCFKQSSSAGASKIIPPIEATFRVVPVVPATRPAASTAKGGNVQHCARCASYQADGLHSKMRQCSALCPLCRLPDPRPPLTAFAPCVFMDTFALMQGSRIAVRRRIS